MIFLIVRHYFVFKNENSRKITYSLTDSAVPIYYEYYTSYYVMQKRNVISISVNVNVRISIWRSRIYVKLEDWESDIHIRSFRKFYTCL